jgi:hypothetical protein
MVRTVPCFACHCNLMALQVLKGSKALYTQLWEAFEHQKPEGGWNVHDRHDHTPEQIQWLLDHGCEWYKVCAEPGDLLLWDSVSLPRSGGDYP